MINKVYNGDNLEVLKKFPDNYFDSIVTDPPYGISFMGKKWDYDVPTVECWKECLRVLKPGGYLLCFAGTRTQHRMAVRIEDAGFEIRDMIAWVYGSGFPKSLNISKAIDKKPNAYKVKEWKKWLSVQINNCGKTKKQINDECGFTATSYIKTDNKDYWSSNLPKNGKWEIMKKIININDNTYDWVAEDNCLERGYIEPTGGLAGGSGNTVGRFTGKQLSDNSIDKNAEIYCGWGTALKPAFEPITVARKPLSEKTIVENILKYGTGGINIDGCRIKTNDKYKYPNGPKGNGFHGGVGREPDGSRTSSVENNPNGRFPANFIHDGSEEVTNGLGAASRFFYCAKSSKSERNAGLENFEERQTDESRKEGNPGGDNPRNRGVNKTQNFHPTVKPIKLMQYLIKLVTQPNGIILDPFSGSGTTGIAAILENMNYVLIEMEKDYCDISNARIDYWIKETKNNKEVKQESFFKE